MTIQGAIANQYASTKPFGQVTVRRMGSREGAAVFANLPDEYFAKPSPPTDGQKDFRMQPQQTDGQRDLTAAWLDD